MTLFSHEYAILGLISFFIIFLCITGLIIMKNTKCNKETNKSNYASIFICTITVVSAFCFSVLLTFLFKYFNCVEYEIYARVIVLIVFLLTVTIFVQRLNNECNENTSEYILGMSYLLIIISILYTVGSMINLKKPINEFLPVATAPKYILP